MGNKLKFQKEIKILLIFLPIIIISSIYIPTYLNSNQKINWNLLTIPFPIEKWDKPFHIHATWSFQNASETITLTWRTVNLQESKIRYDFVSRIENSSAYFQEIEGNASQFPYSNGYIHNVNLTNLTPNTTYYFICGSNSGGWCDEMKFKVPALNSNQIIFAVGGDSQGYDDRRDAISKLMADYNSDFVLYLGDAVHHGTVQGYWDSWFNGIDNYWKTADNRIIPIIPCLGNHEDNAPNYFTQYSLPNNEQWYSIDYSNFLHIICLSSETDISGEQLTWLEEDLKQRNNTIWKIAFFHQPPYSDPYRSDIRQTWCPIFDKYNVSVVFCGHHHLYERSKPIYNETIQSSYDNATMYITSGGWGAYSHEVYTSNWTYYGESTWHFCLVNITSNMNNSTFELKEVKMDNTIGDTIIINKTIEMG